MHLGGHQVYHLLASEHTHIRQGPRRCENQPAGFGFVRRFAVMHCQRDALVFHPYSRQGANLVFQCCSPASYLPARIWRGGLRFRAMIPDHAGYICSGQFRKYVRAGAPRYNDTGIQRRQMPEQFASAGAHARLVRVFDNRREGSIVIEGAQCTVPGQLF
jgi:hypothetical protein